MEGKARQSNLESISTEGWVSYLQGEAGASRNMRIAISSMVLSISAVLISIVLAVMSDILIVYSIVVILLFCSAGSLYVRYLGLKKEEVEAVLTDILKGDLASSKQIRERWLKLSQERGHLFSRR